MTSHEPRCSGVKHCPACDKDKPVLAFGIRRREPDGLYPICRDCSQEESRKRRELNKKYAHRGDSRKLQRAIKKQNVTNYGFND